APARDESDIPRERLALEESIRKVEAESARKFVETARQPPAARTRPIEPRPAEDVEEHSAPPRRYVNPPAQPSQEGRQDAARQDLARQDLARQDLARRPRSPLPPSSKPTPSPPALSKGATPQTRYSGSQGEEPLPSGTDAAAPRHPLRRNAGGSLSEAPGKELRNVVS